MPSGPSAYLELYHVLVITLAWSLRDLDRLRLPEGQGSKLTPVHLPSVFTITVRHQKQIVPLVVGHVQ